MIQFTLKESVSNLPTLQINRGVYREMLNSKTSYLHFRQ